MTAPLTSRSNPPAISSKWDGGYDASTEETYEAACEILHSVHPRSGLRANDHVTRRAGFERTFRDEIPFLLGLLDCTVDDLGRLCAIQITASKGKGSTTAFTSELLVQLGQRNGRKVRVGSLNGPAYATTRDVICINGTPISEALFSKYFWRLWNRLRVLENPEDPESYGKPHEFNILFVLACVIFLEEQVDACVFEVFCGGRFDCTSMIPRPLVVSVGSIEIDHPGTLGDTEEKIAWQKAGLYKDGCAAITVKQVRPSVNRIIAEEAAVAQCTSFTVVQVPAQISSLKLGLGGNKQPLNASIALMNVQAFLCHDRCPAAFSDLKRALGTNRKRDRAQVTRLGQAKSGFLSVQLSQWQIASRRSFDRRYLLSLVVGLLYIVQAVYINPQPFSSIAAIIIIVSCLEVAFSFLYLRPLVRKKAIPSEHSSDAFSPGLLAMPEVASALEGTIFPGRGDAIYDTAAPGLRWLLDCAHTPDSMLVAGSWAKGLMADRPKAKRVLIFIIEPYRPQILMFKNLAKAMRESDRMQPFDYIVFHNDVVTREDFQYDPHLKLVDEMAANWQRANGRLQPKPIKVYKLATIQDAVEMVRTLAEHQHKDVGVDCLATGTWGGDIANLCKLPIRYSKDYVYTPQ